MRISELITGIGGRFGTILMIIAATAEGGNIEGLSNMASAFFGDRLYQSGLPH